MRFIPASNRVPLGTLAAAALDLCGSDRVQLRTGGGRLGVEVPDEWHDRVQELARVMAGVTDDDPGAECVPPPLVTSTAPAGVGRPFCPHRARTTPRAAAAPAGPDHTHNQRHGPRSTRSETG